MIMMCFNHLFCFMHFNFFTTCITIENETLISRPRVTMQLGKLIVCEMKLILNNENLLVATLLLQIITSRGIKNQNIWRPVGQRPKDLEK